MEIGVVIGAAVAWAVTHLYHRRAGRQADLRHQATTTQITAEFKRIPALPTPPSGEDQEAHEFREKMQGNVLKFFFGVVLRRNPETWARTVEAAEDILESAREENDHPERIRALENVVTFLRSPPG